VAFNLGDIIEKLIDIGFYQVFLPFLLVYAVVFAILQKSRIFEGGSSTQQQAKNVNAIVAFVFGLFVVASAHVISLFQAFITNFVIIIIFILCVLLVLGFIFGDSYTDLFKDTRIKYALGGLIVLISIIILFNVLGWWDTISNSFSGSSDDIIETFWTIVGIGAFIGVLYWITKSDSKVETK
jgi:hypothetical protein